MLRHKRTIEIRKKTESFFSTEASDTTMCPQKSATSPKTTVPFDSPLQDDRDPEHQRFLKRFLLAYPMIHRGKDGV